MKTIKKWTQKFTITVTVMHNDIMAKTGSNYEVKITDNMQS